MSRTTPLPPPPVPDDLVVVIDQTGARIYPVARAVTAHPQPLHHLRHPTDRIRHDTDRDQTDPADIRFFDAVADAVAGTGRIVLIGHGKGQSHAAGHLLTHLASHYPAVLTRLSHDLTANLSHATVPELLALARAALHPVRNGVGDMAQ
ncbi:hypothetical protein SAMN04488003_1217 [Loktanella fryxellensis]|uniref:Uncharacterized protein n=1 Tax=Loktanella fryxellensis TaxID=245187 RepID=A0A1H8HHN0_9RHOB|nr:hypothetical protein [Loktanella fryxellensis]SEN55544.1 hypothetical protein SAMN04488003_1217 [Loktanella fryxellensis]